MSRGLLRRTCTPKASPTRGSCCRRRLMRWCSWVIGRASTSSVTAAAVPPSPHRGRLLVLKNQKNAPQKGADQQTWPAPSMDGRYSTATSYKSDTPVSGGAYQDARKVSLVWNDIQNIDACLNSEAERTKRVQALFSPPSFLLREKRWGRRRQFILHLLPAGRSGR